MTEYKRYRAEYANINDIEFECMKTCVLLPNYLMQEVWTNEDGTSTPGRDIRNLSIEDSNPFYLYYIVLI
jgi:hypothetical protein